MHTQPLRSTAYDKTRGEDSLAMLLIIRSKVVVVYEESRRFIASSTNPRVASRMNNSFSTINDVPTGGPRPLNHLPSMAQAIYAIHAVHRRLARSPAASAGVGATRVPRHRCEETPVLAIRRPHMAPPRAPRLPAARGRTRAACHPSSRRSIHHAVLGGTASSQQLLQVKEAFETCASRREAQLNRRKRRTRACAPS